MPDVYNVIFPTRAKFLLSRLVSVFEFPTTGARWTKWLECEFTYQKVRRSNPTSASRLPLSRLGQPDSIPGLVSPSCGMATRHRKGATAERCFLFPTTQIQSAISVSNHFTNFPPLGQPGSIPALVPTSGGMTARHQKDVTASSIQFFLALTYGFKPILWCIDRQSREHSSDLKGKVVHTSHIIQWQTTTIQSCLAAMLPEGSMRAGILPGCPGLDRGSREAEVGFEPVAVSVPSGLGSGQIKFRPCSLSN
ncbi:hypothetical protein T265_07397 [Opisthorchis viverrini]|uniref:Uncharacterized protein n=1 Tax=Opisthorchis viverrini TaxID=6198 RepID=A0A074ZP51_OPIVI|nr:hypothetical protein T265_07397 [Opisthorchis viverrini]KER25110.1 hypothetical protein T265_07397 [Opisthorchis viverrini]